MRGPDELRSFRRHAEWALVVATALELGLIETLAERGGSPREVADRLSLDPRGTEVLLRSLEPLAIVRRDGQRFRLTGSGRAFLIDRDSPDYQADSLLHWLAGLRRWAAELPAAVRGSRTRGEEDPESSGTSGQRVAAFMAAMNNKPPGLVQAVCDAVCTSAPSARSLLDLGGGPGTFARAFAGRGLAVTLLDRPEVVEHVRRSYGLEFHPGIELIQGDFLSEIPSRQWDVILLANITHIYDEATNARLIERAAARLAAGGTLAILDFVRGRADFAALFAVTMLLNTESGGTYDLPCYRTWLAGAGLRYLGCLRVSPEADLVLGRRQVAEEA